MTAPIAEKYVEVSASTKIQKLDSIVREISQKCRLLKVKTLQLGAAIKCFLNRK